MKEPSPYERVHWAAVNAVGRIFAYGLVFVSALFSLGVLATLVGIPFLGELPAFLLVVLVPLGVLGMLMIKAKPSYPEKYREWYERERDDDREMRKQKP